MIEVSAAEQIIQEHLPTLGDEVVSYEKLLGRVSSVDIVAKRPLPPFDRVTMDGIAINSNDWNINEPEFIVQGVQHAGEPAQSLKPKHCIEIMTGAVLPNFANCIIPIEQIEKTKQGFSLINEFNSDQYIVSGRNIHKMGSDHAKNTVLIPAATKLNANHIACLLSAGYSKAKVKKLAKISVIMSGDELVVPGDEALAHQIYASNAPAINALLLAHGQNPVAQYTVADNKQELKQTISNALSESDIVITTGGVSMGKKDFLPTLFTELEVECHFHKVSQKPGKPLWFGSRDNSLLFGLPGNPVSALVTARRYIIPVLERLAGLTTSYEYLTLSKDVIFNPKLSYFLPVKKSYTNHTPCAEPLGFNTSGDTVGLTKSDGFIELDAKPNTFKAGESVRFFTW